MEQTEEERAFSKILRLASVREQSSVGIRTRLSRDGFSEAAIEAALQHAQECSVVNDARYAEFYVRTKLYSGKGRRGIESDLFELGLAEDDIDRFFDECEVTQTEEVDRAVALLERKPTRASNKRAAAYRKLVQNGYSSSVASAASSIWCEKNGFKASGSWS